MAENEDKSMSQSEDPILPIIDRRAPILERIRNRNDESKNLAQNLGELVGKAVKTDSEVEIEETRESFTDGFSSALADELGVSPDDVNIEFVNNVTSGVLDVNEGDVLTDTAIDELGIQLEDIIEEDEEEQSETNDDTGQESGESDGEVSQSSEEEAGGDDEDGEEGTNTESELFGEE